MPGSSFSVVYIAFNNSLLFISGGSLTIICLLILLGVAAVFYVKHEHKKNLELMREIHYGQMNDLIIRLYETVKKEKALLGKLNDLEAANSKWIEEKDQLEAEIKALKEKIERLERKKPSDENDEVVIKYFRRSNKLEQTT